MSQISKCTLERWHRLMKTLAIPENNDTYTKLIEAYSEKHRAYHTLEHIDACLIQLDAVTGETDNPDVIEIALWFHDAIYNPLSSTNEEDSAALAKSFLYENLVASDMTDRVYELIIFTKNHHAPNSADGQLILDIDLSILGAERNIYEQFENNIRKEYRLIPSFIFKRERKKILKSFFERQRLYHSDYFFERYEKQAKENLGWAIRKL